MRPLMRATLAAPLVVVLAGVCAGVGEQPGAKIHPAARAALADQAGPAKLWVYFKDKGQRSPAELAAALEGLRATYDPHAVERRRARRTRPGLFDETDLPVAGAYRAAVAATGARVHVESRWLNAVSVYATAAQARAIAALPYVTSVEPVRAGHKPKGPAEVPVGSYGPGHGDDPYGLAHDQLDQINLIALHSQGFTGTGVRVGILDTGFKRTHAAFNFPGHVLQVIAEWDFINDDNNTGPEAGDDPDQHTHGTLILGTLGAYKPDELIGGAYDAAFILCKTEDITSETPVEEDNYVGGLEFIELHGGDVATASLVYIDWYTYSQLDGLTAVTTVAVNMATSNGLHCCNAAGNSGHDSDPQIGHLGGAPADAFKVLTIGAVTSEGSISGFSSDGPTADGRLKPELLARGSGTQTVSPSNDQNYTGASGTSLSTPVAAGAVACLAQARPWWSVDQMRSNLFTRASEFVANGVPDPLMVRGYGIINAAGALAAECYANCDGSLIAPALNVNDFICFQNRFGLGDPYTNCDGSTIPPVLNVNDFICFQIKFAQGCP